MTTSPPENQNTSSKALGKEIPPPVSRQELPKIVAMECGAAIGKGEMESFVRSFQQSAKRWEFVVYPAMGAFIILAIYGFFLIYSLTRDMTRMAYSMDPSMGEHMESMTTSVLKLSEQMQIMSGHVYAMTNTIEDISEKLDTLTPMLAHMGKMDQSIAHMDQAIAPMSLSIADLSQSIGQMKLSVKSIDESVNYLNKSVQIMTFSTDQMRKDMMLMNRSISDVARPMSYFNGFTPW
ncbi:MAG: hypothetical protein BWK79_08350 [Beggiatoa sp. IS2]|nr:MAG: hypothetical protein BWK79_08350 [Beggiatoa sp. IS2]